jgi:hypothetical protein
MPQILFLRPGAHLSTTLGLPRLRAWRIVTAWHGSCAAPLTPALIPTDTTVFVEQRTGAVVWVFLCPPLAPHPMPRHDKAPGALHPRGQYQNRVTSTA